MKRIDTKGVMKLFGVTQMTVWNWRKGRGDKELLPAYQDTSARRAFGRIPVYFDEDEVLAWAQRNGVRLASTGRVPGVHTPRRELREVR